MEEPSLLFHDKLTDASYFDRIVLWCPSLALLSNLLDQAEINLDMEEDKYVPCVISNMI